MCKLVPNDKFWKYMTTIDIGLGLGLPSLIFSQYIFESGFHVEIEFNQRFHNIYKMNVKTLTEKVIDNLN